MLAVGAFEPGASASPYQTLLRRSLLARGLHHKCFENQLALVLHHTGLGRMGGGVS